MRVRVSGNRRKRLQIMAERISDGHMGIDDCSRLSRALAPVFDLEDPIKDEYDLEISSPGIDRPLMRIEDFERFKGHVAKCETAAMINGQRRFKGVIEGIEGQTIVLVTEQGEARLEFSALSDARLVLTDQLIAEDLKRAKADERNSSPASGGGPEQSEGEGVSLSTDGAAPLSHRASRADSSPRDREAIPSKDDPLAKRAGGGGAKDKKRNHT